MMKLGMCGFTIGAAQYFRQFPVLEVQQTFYDPPAPATLAKWKSQAPADFEFTMKAWQVITHTGTSPTYRRLKRPFDERQRAECGAFRVNATTLAAWQTTLDARKLLDATIILFQCPASFTPSEENVASLREFMRVIERPARVHLAWEPRGKWPPELTRALCRELDLLHAVDPFVSPSATPEVLYWRLHGNRSSYANYTDDELQQLIDWIVEAGEREVYVLFNNIPRVADIRRFRELLAGV
jgi:uncharacterized protein YecE (DUF72 family)